MMRLPLELIIVFVLAQAFEKNFTPVGGKLPPMTAGAALAAAAGLVIMCLLLYLPYALRDHRAVQRSPA